MIWESAAFEAGIGSQVSAPSSATLRQGAQGCTRSYMLLWVSEISAGNIARFRFFGCA